MTTQCTEDYKIRDLIPELPNGVELMGVEKASAVGVELQRRPPRTASVVCGIEGIQYSIAPDKTRRFWVLWQSYINDDERSGRYHDALVMCVRKGVPMEIAARRLVAYVWKDVIPGSLCPGFSAYGGQVLVYEEVDALARLMFLASYEPDVFEYVMASPDNEWGPSHYGIACEIRAAGETLDIVLEETEVTRPEAGLEYLRERVAKAEKAYLAAADFLSVRLRERGHSEEAAALVRGEVALCTDAGQRAFYEYRLGLLNEDLGNFQEAAEAYTRAMCLEPNDQGLWYFIHNNLGYSLNQIGRFGEAAEACRQAINIDPSRHNAYKNLGISSWGMGDLAQAAVYLSRATCIAPNDGRAFAHLEQLLEENDLLLISQEEVRREVEAARAAVGRA